MMKKGSPLCIATLLLICILASEMMVSVNGGFLCWTLDDCKKVCELAGDADVKCQKKLVFYICDCCKVVCKSSE